MLVCLRVVWAGQATNVGGSGDQMAVLGQGFSSGFAQWVFKLDQDVSGDECVLFGAVTKPLTDYRYLSSPSAFLYRCYNGAVYSGGTEVTTEASRKAKVCVCMCVCQCVVQP